MFDVTLVYTPNELFDLFSEECIFAIVLLRDGQPPNKNYSSDVRDHA